jgi:hypothetical protein
MNSVCTGGICQAAMCNDGVKNGDETDADCGGSCPGCVLGKMCNSQADCAPAAAGTCQKVVCQSGVCTAAEDDSNLPAASDACHVGVCTAGVPNQGSAGAGTACGTNKECDDSGNCKLLDGQVCGADALCLNGHCVGGICCDTACTAACHTCATGACSKSPLGTACSSGGGDCVQLERNVRPVQLQHGLPAHDERCIDSVLV